MRAPYDLNIFQDLPGPAHHLEAGPLEIVIRKTRTDWIVGWKRDPVQQQRWVRRNHLPENLDDSSFNWKRFAVQPKTEKLQVRACYPARPVVIRPEAPYAIIPGDKVQFFTSLPLSIRITTHEPEPVVLFEEPARIMSQTWFGEPTEGELCLASRTRAQRDPQDLDVVPHRVICPVRMKNISEQTLLFERFCLRSRLLSLYQSDRHFWSNEIGVSYKGPGEESRVAYHPNAPSFETPMVLHAGPDKTNSESFSLLSFYQDMLSV